MKANMKRVYDPLYGVTTFSDLEFQLLKTPEIQRLRYVRMCNINSLLVTGASEISRFEHVIGTLRLAKEWLSKNGMDMSTDQQEIFLSAALLHDFQTGPFGHSLQYVLEDNESDQEFIHENISHGSRLKYHQTTDANAVFSGRPFASKDILGSRWNTVADLIRGKGSLGKLIAGTIDIDNIDNVVRLAYHVGIASSEDAKLAIQLATDLHPTELTLEISRSSIPLIQRWQSIRRRLYELLLLDWAEFSAKAMLTRAMDLSIALDIVGADCWIKTDLELLNYLETKSTGEAQYVGILVKKIKCGDLYNPIYIGTSSSTEMYTNFSNYKSKCEIESQLTDIILKKTNKKINLLIHPILDVKKTDRSIDVTLKENKEKVTIGSNSRQLLIGIFSPTLDASDEQLDFVIEQFLSSKGMRDITPISDPMGIENKGQLSLL